MSISDCQYVPYTHSSIPLDTQFRIFSSRNVKWQTEKAWCQL